MIAIKQYSAMFVNETRIIKTFNYWWQAYLYKICFYDFIAEPAWKMTFEWTIVKNN